MEYTANDQKLYHHLSQTFLKYINNNHKLILDVGCGNGDNEKMIKIKFPNVLIDGITISKIEKENCQNLLRKCYLIDVSKGDFSCLNDKYDLIIFSHILEHLAYPKDTLDQFYNLLNPNGEILIIVPNVMHYLNRFNLIRGKFDYTEQGILDFTHFRFFTYQSVINLLVNQKKYSIKRFDIKGISTYSILYKILGRKITSTINKITLKLFPNLFAEEFILLLSIK